MGKLYDLFGVDIGLYVDLLWFWGYCICMIFGLIDRVKCY